MSQRTWQKDTPMKLLRRLPVAWKLAAGFTTALLMMIGSSLLSVAALQRMNQGVHTIADDSLPSIENATALAQAVMSYRLEEYRLAAEPNPDREGAARELDARRSRLAGQLDRARTLASSAVERQAVAAVVANWRTYVEVSARIEAAARAGSPEARILFFGASRHRFDGLMASAKEIVAINERDASETGSRADALYGTIRGVLLVVVIMAALTVGALAYFITRSITRPLKAAVSAAQAISDDELTTPMPREEGDEIAQLALALDHVSAHRSKNVSISKMSHELRTPLNAILGFAQVLLADRVHPLSPLHRQRVERILRSGNQLLSLVNDLLDLSRIAAGFMALKSEDVNALEASRAAVQELAALATRQAIKVSVTARAGATYRVRADRTRVAQVLANLISNAIKYNRQGGSVHVELQQLGDRMQLTVRDTGIGMSQDQIDGLFRPFDRLGRETSGIQGTGLGLVITSKLIKLMGGTLDVRSTPGVGSEFVVGLALAADQRVPGEESPDARGTGAGLATDLSGTVGRVLYVDDDETNRALMQAYFSLRPQIQLALVSDGASAIAIAERQCPELMLIDIMMPGMDGFAVLKEVRQHPGLRATRCIAVSANAMSGDAESALAVGFDGYLTKPLSIAQLFAEVDKWLPRSDAADTARSA